MGVTEGTKNTDTVPHMDPSIHPYTCQCGTQVRTITMTDLSTLVINTEPSPHGRIIPWLTTPTGVPHGRLLDQPIDDGPMWEAHECR